MQQVMVDAVWYVDWWESEKGWGQNFVSTHTFSTKDEADKAIKDHWEKQPHKISGTAPDYYMFPKSDPYLKESRLSTL